MKLKHLSLLGLALSTLSSLALANDFPVTFKTKFGEVTIKEQPQRVATLDYSGADDLLALGVQPVTVRYWYGDYPRAVWPWADKLLKGNPTIIKEPIDFEAVAKSKPDVILALWSGITEDDYKKLSAIAPVVGVPEGVGDYALPWDERALLAARAIGKEELAKEKVDAINKKFEEAKVAHPNWQGKQFSVATLWKGAIAAYTDSDIRPLLLNKYGLVNNKEVKNFAPEGSFYAELSNEQIKVIDKDLIIWLKDTGDDFETVKGRRFLKAKKEGREIFVDVLLASAFSHASLLSLPFVYEELTPQLEKALGK